MAIDRSYSSETFKPKLHRVLIETEPGKWQILGDTGSTPIELLKLEVQRDHAISMQQQNVMIVDQDSKPVEAFHNYIPKPQPSGEPITEENARIRDRWIGSVIRWLLPRELQEADNTPVARARVKEMLDACEVTISVRPDGCAVLIYRAGATLAEWAC